jgi:predicted acetyltransferase
VAIGAGFVQHRAMRLELRRPSLDLQRTFLDGLDELDGGERSSWIYLGATPPALPRGDFAAYLQRLREREHAPPPPLVPDTTYWAIRGSEMVGRISLRHTLTEPLRREGGHIGYIVRPSARRQGVATEMLRQLLATDRARSLGRLLLTCEEDNLASEKSIRKSGGVLQDVVDADDGQRQKRFWITVA